MTTIRNAAPGDLSWLPRYVLDGFDHRNYTPNLPRITAMIEACMRDDFALIAAGGDGKPEAVLGGLVQPLFWADGNELTVVALRSTRAGAGLSLLNELFRRVALRFDIRHVVVNFDPFKTDPRVEHLMRRRFGAQPMRCFLTSL